jgi:hypothetical protein
MLQRFPKRDHSSEVIESGEDVPTEAVTMRQLLLIPWMLRSTISLMSLAVLVVGCASHSLVPKEQAAAIKSRERALAPHSRAIHDTIRQSGHVGALAFLEAGDGRLVVLPGNSPADAWARYSTSTPGGPTGQVSIPEVVDFVYRPDVPKAPESVTHGFLQQQQALRTTLADFDSQLSKLSDSVVETRKETQTSIATTREDIKKAEEEMRKALDSLAKDLATARGFMLQTAQLGWLDHELIVQNADGIRKVTVVSQELTANSAKLTDAIQHLSDGLARQLKELADRLDAIQNRISNVK